MNNVDIAIHRIQAILLDHVNYQTNSLKLGAIWNYCEWAAAYHRLDTINGESAIEVITK